jgi:hypothetical protein
MPPLRLAILEDVAANPGSRTPDVRQRLNKPRNTVDRQLQSLHMLGVLTCTEVEDAARQRSNWHYYVDDSVDPSVIRCVPDLSPLGDAEIKSRGESSDGDISGTGGVPNGEVAWDRSSAEMNSTELSIGRAPR